MAIIMSKKPIDLPPTGTFPARCYQMIHIGTIDEEYKGNKKTINKVRLGFELPTERKVFNPDKGEQPYVISQDYTLSMSKKSKLKSVLESWRGIEFSKEEMSGFDITELIGSSCLITIAHKVSESGSQYAQITNVTQPIRGMDIPKLENDVFVLSFDDVDFIDKVESLPDFIKDKVKSSKEYGWIINENTNDNSI